MWLHSSVGRALHRYSRRSWFWIPLKSWFFQASSFQLLKLENLLQWSFFTFINNCSSDMWVISYIHLPHILTYFPSSVADSMLHLLVPVLQCIYREYKYVLFGCLHVYLFTWLCIYSFIYVFLYFLLSFSAYDKVPISTIHLRKTEIQRQGRQRWCYEIISFKRQKVIATQMYSNIFRYDTAFVSVIERNHCKFFTQVHLLCINFL